MVRRQTLLRPHQYIQDIQKTKYRHRPTSTNFPDSEQRFFPALFKRSQREDVYSGEFIQMTLLDGSRYSTGHQYVFQKNTTEFITNLMLLSSDLSIFARS